MAKSTRCQNKLSNTDISRLLTIHKIGTNNDITTIYGGFLQWSTPKWMVYNGKILLKWMIGGYPHFRRPPYLRFKNRCDCYSKLPHVLHRSNRLTPSCVTKCKKLGRRFLGRQATGCTWKTPKSAPWCWKICHQ